MKRTLRIAIALVLDHFARHRLGQLLASDDRLNLWFPVAPLDQINAANETDDDRSAGFTDAGWRCGRHA